MTQQRLIEADARTIDHLLDLAGPPPLLRSDDPRTAAAQRLLSLLGTVTLESMATVEPSPDLVTRTMARIDAARAYETAAPHALGDAVVDVR